MLCAVAAERVCRVGGHEFDRERDRLGLDPSRRELSMRRGVIAFMGATILSVDLVPWLALRVVDKRLLHGLSQLLGSLAFEPHVEHRDD